MIPQTNPGASYEAHKEEIDTAVQRVLTSGWYVLGKEVEAFEQEFAKALGYQWTVGVASGTDAVEIALRAAGIVAGDIVVTVSHTAVATVAAIARMGAIPVFVDIDPLRYTMDPQSLAAVLRALAPRKARALIVVHLYGQLADMPQIEALAREHSMTLIEDCAQCHGASLNGLPAGSWGALSCFSFYPTKNLGAFGDGGAIGGNDVSLRDRVRTLREYGWRERYVSEAFGVNSRLDELQAAMLRVRLKYLTADNAARQNIAALYDHELSSLPIQLPFRVPGTSHVFHQYVVAVDDRDGLRSRLGEHGVGTAVHYPVPVHLQPAYSHAEALVPLTVTELVARKVLSLPMYPQLTNAYAEQVCTALRASHR